MTHMTHRVRSLCWGVGVLGVLAIVSPRPAAGNTLVVKEVRRADIIQFANGWTTRLTGVLSPDTSTAVGRQAWEFTRSAVAGRRVAVATLTTDNTAAGIVRDSQGYPFARVFYGPPALAGKKSARDSSGADGGCSFPEPELNVELLRLGYARVDSQFAFDDLREFQRLEQDARAEGLGIWARP